jgi:hypothetical protein
MKASYIFTGSAETEAQIAKLLNRIDSIDKPAPLSEWEDDIYILSVMVKGRNGPFERREGSLAPDDTGGFFEIREDKVYLTAKAKNCIRI